MGSRAESFFLTDKCSLHADSFVFTVLHEGSISLFNPFLHGPFFLLKAFSLFRTDPVGILPRRLEDVALYYTGGVPPPFADSRKPKKFSAPLPEKRKYSGCTPSGIRSAPSAQVRSPDA